jgi:oligoribonuclease NrnB/cAMP/cGMP phosphodiesterase (DHH superfamily)
MSLLCIYHANCADGFTAAWAVWRAHPDTEFHEGIYGVAPPNCENRDVVLVDFSYKRSVLLEISEVANSVLILDHHKSAESELIDLPDNVTAIFDMERSGAMMAWEHYHPDQPPSDLVVHVQDRDLWQFKREQTRAFQANLFSLEYTFENWDMVNALCADDYKYHQFVAEGEAIERKHFKDVAELIRVAATRQVIAGIEVPILNAPYFYSSDAGHIMGKGEQFAACYWDTPQGRVFSLRSEQGAADVSEIAAKFGGGGHKHSAGFRLPFDELDRLATTA